MVKLTDNAFLFGFDGRINRAKYWYAGFASLSVGLVFLSVSAAVVGFVFGTHLKSVDMTVSNIFGTPASSPIAASFAGADPQSEGLMRLLFYVLGTPVFVLSMWILAAATIKRLHDRDRSGWWMMVLCIGPPLLDRIGDRLDAWDALGVFPLLASLLTLWGVVELAFLKGTRGPNRFGADPLAPVDTRPGWDQQSEIEFVPHKAGPPASPHVMRGHD
jgi:uncharacterized membrane protein YhaH (DUF805 family)